MATGGRLSRSKLNASDEVIDFCCSPCRKKNKSNDAVKYCAECQEYLCTTCVESHNSFSILAGHTLLGRSNFGTSSGTKSGDLPSVPTERCKMHATKVVDMYCENHDTVGCLVCFTINHKSCQDTHYIPEYVKTNFKTLDVERSKTKIEQAIQQMKQLHEQQLHLKDEAKKAKSACLHEIESFREEINKAVDRLEAASLAELDKVYQEMGVKLQKQIKNAQEILDELNEREMELKSSDGNISQQFVFMKMSETTNAKADKLIPNSSDVQSAKFVFTKNSKILDTLSSHHSLGISQHQKQQGLYRIQNSSTVCVSHSTDKLICHFNSQLALDSGDIFITDYANGNVRIVEGTSLTVKDCLNLLPLYPLSVCRANTVECVVVLTTSSKFWTSKGKIQFVSTQDKLKLTRSFGADHFCRGISVIGCELFVSDMDKRVYIYTMDGELQKTFYKDQKKKEIFSMSCQMAESDDGKLLHVTDLDNGLVTIDRGGNVMWRYSGPELKAAWGICTDGNGNIFVTGKESHNVVQIGPGGQYLGEVVSASCGIKYPYAICFDKKNSKLIIGRNSCSDIHIFTIK